jgi:hypothetical protein
VARRRDARLALALAGLAALGWLVREDERILEVATVKSSLYGLELLGPAIAVLAVCAAVLIAAWVRRRESWTVACLAPAAVFAAMLGWWVVPALEPKKSTRPMWNLYLQERAGPGEPIGALGPAKDSYFYYSDNAIERVDDPGEIEEFLRGPGVRFLIAPESTYRQIAGASPGRWELLDDSHSTHVLGRYTGGTESRKR